MPFCSGAFRRGALGRIVALGTALRCAALWHCAALRCRYDGYTVAGALCSFLAELPSPGLVPPAAVDRMRQAIEQWQRSSQATVPVPDAGTESLLKALRKTVSAIGEVERAHFHALLWLLTQA